MKEKLEELTINQLTELKKYFSAEIDGMDKYIDYDFGISDQDREALGELNEITTFLKEYILIRFRDLKNQFEELKTTKL